MPNLDNHLEIARNNERFSQDLISEQRYLDWAVTGLFYSAIHYVEAYLATRNFHSASHRMRDSELAQDATLITVYDEYNDLKNDSVQTRYYGYIFPRAEVVSRIQPSFQRIRNYITRLLP